MYKMKENIKSRVVHLIGSLSDHHKGPRSVRGFCTANGINYKSLDNAFRSDSMGIGLIDSFKKAVPNLNMNWFIYGEGNVFFDPQTTQ